MMLDRGIPLQFRLSIPNLLESYAGRLYYFIGPGLGDTVNGFRIFHEVVMRYPQSHAIVYLDPRWKSLYPLIPELSSAEVRYYSEASSTESDHQPSRSFHRTLDEIIEQMMAECRQYHAYIAMGAFKLPDRLPQKETLLAMYARAISLPLSTDRQRPYCPLSDEVRKQAQHFLESNGLREGGYLAISPSTLPHKMWSADSWAILIKSVHRDFGLNALIMGVDGYQEFEGPNVKGAMNLPLGIVAALIASARCYVGLDSGLTHVAACSDVPIVTLNPQGEFPPFCVEPHSPFRWTHLSPFIYGRRKIPVESVVELVRAALRTSLPPLCPLCNKGGYVLGVLDKTMFMLCRCGLLYRVSGEDSVALAPSDQVGAAWELPSTAVGLSAFRDQLAERRRDWKLDDSGTLALRFQHWDPLDTQPREIFTPKDQSELWWTWDAAFSLVVACGWEVVESKLQLKSGSEGPRFSVSLKVVPDSYHPQDAKLAIPWGRQVLRVQRSFYVQWLSWGSFRKSGELEGMGWAAAKGGDTSNGRTLSLLAFRIRPCWKTASRLTRVLCMSGSCSQPA